MSCAMATYKGELLVDFVVGRLNRAACVHLDAFSRVCVVASLAIRQQIVFRQNRVASVNHNQDEFLNRQTTWCTLTFSTIRDVGYA